MAFDWNRVVQFLANEQTYNGPLSIGLAGECDTMVDDAKKLRVFPVPPNSAKPAEMDNADWLEAKRKAMIVNTCAIWYSNQDNNYLPDEQIRFYMASIITCLTAGVLTSRNGENDGGWMLASAEETATFYDGSNQVLRDAFTVHFRAAGTKAMITSVATMNGACKINWWKENHHVGQGAPSGFYKKVADAIRPKICPNVSENDFWHMCHTTSKWMSTRAVLTQLGVINILHTTPVIQGRPGHTFEAAVDAGLRINSTPAGTARLALANAIAKIAFKSLTGSLMPGLTDFLTLSAEYQRVMQNPAYFHMGGPYLTGATTRAPPNGSQAGIAFNDDIYNNMLGRLGTWVDVQMRASTLNRSPHIANKKYKTCSDFDEHYYNLLVEMKRATKININALNIRQGYSGVADSWIAVTNAFGLSRNQNVLNALQEAAQHEAVHNPPHPNNGDPNQGNDGEEDDEGGLEL